MVDQLTKTYLYDPTQRNVHDWKFIAFNADTTVNRGVAFSTFTGQTAMIQTIGFIVFIFSLIAIFTRIKPGPLILIAVIAGGAMGNIIDRFMIIEGSRGGVRDFITFPWWKKYAIFNFADSFVFVGAIILVIWLMINLVFAKDDEDNINEKENTDKS